MSDVLFIAAHPDDETLGCGGTILKHRSQGDRVFWAIITNVHEKDGWDKELVTRRQAEIEKVETLYGFEKTFKLDFPTIRLDTVPMCDLAAAITGVMNEVKPSTVYIPNGTDIHTDHQIVFNAAASCTKNFRFPFIKRVLMYECLSETEFAPPLPSRSFDPNVFIDITDFFDRKIEIMKVYGSEIMDPPGPRSLETIEHLAGYRGSRIGARYAEAFVLLEEIA